MNLDFVLVFLKGIVMGIANLIPGLSASTMALVMGIYPRFIRETDNAIKFMGKGFKRKVDFGFLAILGLGVIIAILGGARLMADLLETHGAFAFAFFAGLIAASGLIMLKAIKEIKVSGVALFLIGLVFAAGISFLAPASGFTPSLWYIFIGGFFAACAMFVPGVSGSFVLLIMGIYTYMIESLAQISQNALPILIFCGGALVGAAIVSHIISHLLKKRHDLTMLFLFGLVIGGLVMPIREIMNFGVGIPATELGVWYGSLIILCATGVGLVIILSRIGNKLPATATKVPLK